MKFITKTASTVSPRLGVVTDIANRPDFAIETPLVMLYTRGGSIPHITHEIFKICCKDPQILQIPIASTYQYHDVIGEFGEDITKFFGLKDCVSCVTVQDPGDLTQPGHHYKNHVPLWTKHGKILINSKSYMDIIESFQPDMYYTLSDGDTNLGSQKKRLAKAVDNTIKFFNDCIERHKKSEVLKNSFVMAAIAGGYCTETRKKCVDAVLAHSNAVGGFLIDGLHNNGPEVEFLPFSEAQKVVEFVVKSLPSDKLRAIHGCWNPVNVIKLVKMGIDVFDTSYSYIVTERSSALTFSLDPENESQVFEINLRHPKYADDFRPISSVCKCLACTKHSRGYIYHLITVQELLGPLLLTIHNIHYYMMFFEKIRSCIADGTLDALDRLVSKQFEDHQERMNKGKDTVSNVNEN